TGCRGRPQAGCGNGSLTPDDLPYASNAHKGSAVIRSGSAGNVVLVTGAGGQIGSRLSSLLRAAGHRVLAVDIHANALENVEPCDIRRDDHTARLFDSASIRTVVHLAGVLPTAFRPDPKTATEVNLPGT